MRQRGAEGWLSRAGWLIGACLWLAGGPALASASLVNELSFSRGYAGLTLLGDVELWKDRTFLSLCYGRAQSTRFLGGTAPGDLELSPTHMGCAGVDHALDTHWLTALTVTASPRATTQVALAPGFGLRSHASSAGLNLAFAYDSGGLSELEFSVDASLAGTLYALPREWLLRTESGAEVLHQVPGTSSRLGVIRPQAGLAVRFGFDTELSLRGSLNLYGRDPLTATQITREELLEVVGALEAWLAEQTRVELSEQQAQYLLQTAGGRMLLADAATGLPSAPVWFELRGGLSQRLSRDIRAQAQYALIKYVPTQGDTHVLSTRWTFRSLDWLRWWGGLAIQVDRLPGAGLRPSVLVTAGTELRFGEPARETSK